MPAAKKKNSTSLYEALLLLENNNECQRFFADLCTPQEIKALQERWKVCQLLAEGKLSYREIQLATEVSLATITRVARFLRQERHHGYKLVLEKIEGNITK